MCLNNSLGEYFFLQIRLSKKTSKDHKPFHKSKEEAQWTPMLISIKMPWTIIAVLLRLEAKVTVVSQFWHVHYQCTYPILMSSHLQAVLFLSKCFKKIHCLISMKLDFGLSVPRQFRCKDHKINALVILKFKCLTDSLYLEK